MLTSKPTCGFSLIELLIGIALMGILLAVGLPAFTSYAQNARVLASAQGLQNALQAARAEAVRINTNVEMVLTDSLDPDTTSLDVSGKNILIRFKPSGATNYTLVEARDGREGSGQTFGSTPKVKVTGTVSKVTFSSLSNTDLTSKAVFLFTSQSDGAACASASGPIRCLNVEITPGGQSRLCDPQVAAGDTTDSRACSAP